MSEEAVSPWRGYLEAVGLVALITGVCFAFRSRLQATDVAMLYLLVVVAVASRRRLGAAVLASVLGIAAFDFVFVPPYYTFAVHDASYVLTFGVMLAVALVMSRLTARIRTQAEDAREREARTAAIYQLSRELEDAAGRRHQVALVERHLGRAAGGDAVVVLAEDSLDDGGPGWPAGDMFESVAVRVAAGWAWQQGESAGLGTTRCAEAEALAVPLRSAARRLGVAVVRPSGADGILSAGVRRTLEGLADRAAVALERTVLAERHEQARLEVEAERLRNALLSSLSHDLRTPLATVEGAASSLLHQPETLPLEVRRDLAETILEESRRMTRLVANLLAMVKVETGGLAVQKSWQPLEEVLGVALLRLEDRLASHPVTTLLPADLPLVPVDELLLEQVFLNLLDNAAKHSPPGTPIAVSARLDSGNVVVEVADRGPGVPAGAEEAVFRKFYRARSAEQSVGAGLGLTICRGIIAAHGGRIWVETPPGGGAVFRFTLPLEGPPPAALPADRDEC